jgi:hypothetical protein
MNLENVGHFEGKEHLSQFCVELCGIVDLRSCPPPPLRFPRRCVCVTVVPSAWDTYSGSVDCWVFDLADRFQ